MTPGDGVPMTRLPDISLDVSDDGRLASHMSSSKARTLPPCYVE